MSHASLLTVANDVLISQHDRVCWKLLTLVAKMRLTISHISTLHIFVSQQQNYETYNDLKINSGYVSTLRQSLFE